MNPENQYVAFVDTAILARGDLFTVALAIKQLQSNSPGALPLIFSLRDGRQLDINANGEESELRKRFANDVENEDDAISQSNSTLNSRPRGRPRLGVKGREITLLPRHWQWLDQQRGGASATLRRLVDLQRKASEGEDLIRHSQDRTNRFLSAIAGDLPGFEAATRALYANDVRTFEESVRSWPNDLKLTASEFAQDAFTQQN